MLVRLAGLDGVDAAVMNHYVKHQYAALLATTPKHSDMWRQLPAADRFCCAYARKMVFPRGKRILGQLWQLLRDGVISEADAIARLPARNLAMAKMEAEPRAKNNPLGIKY
jgi:hypothetical protein